MGVNAYFDTEKCSKTKNNQAILQVWIDRMAEKGTEKDKKMKTSQE